MGQDFSVNLTADVDRAPDGGRVSHLSLRHRGVPVLDGLAVAYDDEPVIVDEITCNELLLPTPAARRLLGRLYQSYMPMVGEVGDSGLIASLNLRDFIGRHYSDVREQHALYCMIQQALRTFSRASSR